MELLRWAVDDLGVTALVSLHQVDFALEFSDRVIGLAKGELLYDGDPDALSEKTIYRIYGDVTDSPEAPFGHGGKGAAVVSESGQSEPTINERDAMPAIAPDEEVDPGAGESIVAVEPVGNGSDAR